MFDDPNKALKKLQEQLWAAEESEEDIFAAPSEPEDSPDGLPEEYEEYEYGEGTVPEQQDEPDPPRKNTKALLLMALLLLEVAALFAVLAWWLLW